MVSSWNYQVVKNLENIQGGTQRNVSRKRSISPGKIEEYQERVRERESERIYPQISSGQLKKVKQNFVVITHA